MRTAPSKHPLPPARRRPEDEPSCVEMEGSPAWRQRGQEGTFVVNPRPNLRETQPTEST